MIKQKKVSGQAVETKKVSGQADLQLAFTRHCHYQYCTACIAIKDCRGETLYCAKVWAVKGGSGVPKQGGCLQMIVLILIRRPITKRISCKGQSSVRVDTGGGGWLGLKTETAAMRLRAVQPWRTSD